MVSLLDGAEPVEGGLKPPMELFRLPGLNANGPAPGPADPYLRSQGVAYNLKLRNHIKRNGALSGFSVGDDQPFLVDVVAPRDQEPVKYDQGHSDG